MKGQPLHRHPCLDWSEFHPLDHHILDPYCWGWAGGIGRHIEMWWKYQFRADLPWMRPWHRRRCRQGIHDITAWYGKLPDVWTEGAINPADGLMCYRCDWSRTL